METATQQIETRAIEWLSPHRNLMPADIKIILVTDLKELLAKVSKSVMLLNIEHRMAFEKDEVVHVLRVTANFRTNGTKAEMPCIVDDEKNLAAFHFTEQFIGWSIIKAVCDKFEIAYAVITPATMNNWND